MDIARQLRDITKKEAIESYHELQLTPAKSPDLSRIGLKALDYFFLHHRIKAKTKRHISFYDAMRDKDTVKHLDELVLRYKKLDPSRDYDSAGLLKARYQVFQLYYGTINQFRPTIAKWVYSTLKPVVGILDFSSGWGGRLLAAMSMGIPYIGIDANKNLERAYSQMIQTYQPDANVTMIFKPSEQIDFSKFKYDLIFTSPPYFMLEEYEKMPAYSSKQDFLDRFFIPVVMSVWKHLLPGGNMALNMPDEMYQAVKGMLPKIKKTLKLPLSNRHPTDASKQDTLGVHNKERHELIYVWHKQR
jgi:hypothetical protein